MVELFCLVPLMVTTAHQCRHAVCYLCLEVLGRQDGPPVVGCSPWTSSFILNGLPGSLLLLLDPPVFPFPPQEVLLRLPWDGFWWNQGAYRCQLVGRFHHIWGALRLCTGDFYWTEGGSWSLTRGFNGLQVDAGQWVVWGFQSREAVSWVHISASRRPLLRFRHGFLLTHWSSVIVWLNLWRPNVHFILLTSGWTGVTGDGQFDLECVRWLFSITRCRANDQDRGDTAHCSQRSSGWLGTEGWFCWRINSVDNQTWSLKDKQEWFISVFHG